MSHTMPRLNKKGTNEKRPKRKTLDENVTTAQL